MAQWCVLCPHNHLLKATTTTGDIRDLSSPLVDQLARCPVRARVGVSASCPVTDQLDLSVILDNSRTGWLADWTSRGLDISWTGQLADATGDFAFACLVFVLLAASASPRVGNPRVGVSASCPVTDLYWRAFNDAASSVCISLTADVWLCLGVAYCPPGFSQQGLCSAFVTFFLFFSFF